MKVFVDANILIDYILKREGFFEDALQNECAMRANSDVIVTRDVKGFAASPIQALSPAEFIELFEDS
jgi:predicted nucleic acid-binding protein